ncbi:DEAD/DEAH box helicase [Mycolicibacterium mucogenicum]|uniref:DEAD/DEAH box helicase n=1 Tax=Mycolicibacterium mucogenicum DSM 44124 TaxID=1226753 RepID=A0A8E4W3V9_MYCMU|nr:DEAD/DEAH box helicase [Mycolicibacterium mucogenicum]KAB7753964.1 DEAD/DEAH box helicase [Mycolicibacterium mucogenicum DSM 44124]QPG70733.1 DEAD/DEAH box helicase [Mycolicibacterium mucogenicum DSM 44124]
MTATPDPAGLFERLRDTYFRYYGTPFRLANDKLNAERRARLDRAGGAWQHPLFEARPRYESAGHTIAESCQVSGADPDLAAFVSLGMFKNIPSLYWHQEKALEAALRGDDIAAIPGTGSGKTETLFLPVIARLLAESRNWKPTRTASTDWWSNAGDPFVPLRHTETGRPCAVRAFVLYPMNALADDQLIRLRKSLDSNGIHQWLDRHRNGHRFYFGRYTGTTPVLGDPSNNSAVNTLRDYMRETDGLYRAALGESEQKSFFVPRPLGAEMISRWDILADPPDILITNYSMLHVMLMRDHEQTIFARTAAWLRDDPNVVVSLIVDESHLYRGTAGTEVGYMLRLLGERLGLASTPERLQILTGSASLQNPRDGNFLKELFAKGKAFTFIEGKYLPVPGDRVELTAHLDRLLQPVDDTASADAIFGSMEAEEALLSAFHLGNPLPAPAVSQRELAERLFPGAPYAETATRNLLSAAALRTATGATPLRLRTHYYFRNVPGIWACTDPGCTAVTDEGTYTDPDRTVGRLYAEPQSRCICGSRVLELHYCQDCGDVYLGGFTSSDPIRSPSAVHSLLADVSDLARLPDQAKTERLPTNYVVYWPRASRPVETEWGINALKSRYIKAVLETATGDVKALGPLDVDPHTGWVFRLTPRLLRGAYEVEATVSGAFPTLCASCGANWELSFLKKDDPERYRSPVRGLRTGFEKINQVLVGELADQLGENDRKLILFSDSRQDAAKLSAGVGIRHYQDLIRSVFVEQMHALKPFDGTTLQRARDWYTRAKSGDDERAAAAELRERAGIDGVRLRDIWEDGGDPVKETPLITALTRLPTIPQVHLRVQQELLAMGVNPGGPYPRFQKTSANDPWTSVYDFSATPIVDRANPTLEQASLQRSIQGSGRDELYRALAGGAGRDIESLGLGWIAQDSDSAREDSSGRIGIARASLRLLVLRQRIDGIYRSTGPHRPAFLTQFWSELGDPNSIEDSCRTVWGSAVTSDWVARPSELVVRAPVQEWFCPKCNRRHLVFGAGICTRCRTALPSLGQPYTTATDDYYAWKAATKNGRFRFNTAELTGQTDRSEAQSRQLRFQGVFLDSRAVKIADEVDLLSVTTTLEAGIDIGDLNAVAMANMPPTRFNYQQRVGRAGRRETNVAYALTVCRGRSHDEYYFERPHVIANDETPPPYLTFSREAIYYRILRSEMLRRAFQARRSAISSTTLNPHGDFGQCRDWPANRMLVEPWLAANHAEFARVASALAQGTSLAAPVPEPFLTTLLDDATNVAQQSHGPADLSERLAHYGLLPMFGFPTRVRYMYLARPISSYPWPPKDTIDRDLSLAISAFAPGAETVRDGSTYRSAAIVAFQRGGYRPVAVDDPMGPPIPVNQCRLCGSVSDADTSVPHDPLAVCPQCGADPTSYRRIDVREPLGFGSTRGQDFDGSFSWTGGAGAVRALGNPNDFPGTTHRQMEARCGWTRRIVLNDNNGNQFRFRKAKPGTAYWPGYYAVDALDWPGVVEAKDLEPAVLEVALGAAQHTDVAFFGGLSQVDAEAGVRANLALRQQPGGIPDLNDGRRAAWYSLAFMIRTAAAAHLDVQPNEFSAEIHIGRRGTEQAVWAFLADTLENGAGFSTHLASAGEFEGFVKRIQTLIAEWEHDDHSKNCSASCYKCLRDYANMRYHALLDWRLAKDLFEVSLGQPLIVPPDYGSRVLSGWAQAYGASPPIQTPTGSYLLITRSTGTAAVLVRHPLEAYEDGANSVVTPRLSSTANDLYAAETFDAVVAIDSLSLDRTPRAALELIDTALTSLANVSW